MGKKWFLKRETISSQILLLLLTILLGTILVQADDPNKAGLVVVHGNGEVTELCVDFSNDEISGYELLERSGLDFNVDVGSGMGGAICRIDAEGCSFPENECFCQCQGSPCIFWIYWHLDAGDWQFASLGASNSVLRDGDIDGWVWGEGHPNEGGVKPPVVTFEEICGRPSKFATPTPTNTPSPTPTNTPEPSDAPEPTDTPKPNTTPIIEYFKAERTTINPGEDVTLSWDLSQAEAVYLGHDGQEEGVIAPGSTTVSPTESTVYTLVAKNEGGENTAQVTVTVNDVPAPSTTTLLPASTATAPSVSTSAISIPEPDITFTAASLTLPPGACTNVQWSVQQAESLFLDDNPVKMQGTQQVCPPQNQTLRLRAVYRGGEKMADLTLTVIDPQVAPTNIPSPTTIASKVETLATPVAVVVSSAAESGTSTGPRRFTVPTESGDSDSTGIWWAGAVVATLGLFVIVPVALIVTGWVVWWLKGKKR